MLNPIAQIKKAEDADKRNHALQLKNALDQYYHDKSSFPTAANFATDLKAGNYIKEIRSDVTYKTDVTAQWFVVSMKKSLVQVGVEGCQLSCSSMTKPSDYICAFEGEVDITQC